MDTDSAASRPPGRSLAPAGVAWIGVFLGALFFVVVATLGPQLPTLEGTIAEVDGVFPLRAVGAWTTAYAHDGGFLDKYPPLPTWIAGGLLRLTAPEFVAAVEAKEGVWDPYDRVSTVALEPGHTAALTHVRLMSTLAMAWVVGLLASVVAAWSTRLDASQMAAIGAACVVSAAFACSNVVLYHAVSTNVDALVLAFSMTALALLARSEPRVLAAAVFVALAVATKDPAYALGVVLVAVAWARGGVVLAAKATGLSLAVYAVASGAVVDPARWWQRATYLVSGGVDTVPRIDPGSLSEWWQLARHLASLTWLSIGHVLVAAAVVGAACVVVRRRRDGAFTPVALVTLLGILAPIVLFVVPVRFAFSRFLFVPYVMVAALAGLALAWLTDLAGWRARLVVLAGAVAVIVIDGERSGAFDIAAGRVLEASSRREAAAYLEQHVPKSGHIVVFTSAAYHALPVDPRERTLHLHGLENTNLVLSRLKDKPANKRPRAMAFMEFTMDVASGAPQARPAVPPIGQRLANMYEVVKVFGTPLGRAAERTLPVRPLITVLKRLD